MEWCSGLEDEGRDAIICLNLEDAVLGGITM